MIDLATTRFIGGARIRRQWRFLVGVGLVAGMIGGAIIGMVAGAFRTTSAYDSLISRTGFPDAFVQLIEPRPGLVDEIEDLPSVSSAVIASFSVGLRSDTETISPIPVQTSDTPAARFPIIEGRRPDPNAAEEVMVSPGFAAALGIDVGDVIPYRMMTDADFAGLLRRKKATASGPELHLRVVGTFRTPTDVNVEDFPTLTGTPALHRELPTLGGSSGVWVHLRPGSDAAELTRQLEDLAGPGDEDRFNSVSVTDFAAERRSVDDATDAVSRGMLAAAALTAIAGLVLLAQLVNRSAESDRPDRHVLRRLGLPRSTSVAADASSGLPTALVAAGVAPAVAWIVSRSMPLGVARLVEPDPGFEADVVTFSVGSVALLVVTLAWWTIVTGRAGRPSGPSKRTAPPFGRRPETALAAWIAVGGSARRSSRALAFVGVTATVAGAIGVAVFAASLHDLVDRPEKWGWPGELSIEVTDPIRDDLFAALDGAPEVAAYAEIRLGYLEVDGAFLTAYSFDVRHGDMEPLMISGRLPRNDDEVAVGPRLAVRNGWAVGDALPTAQGPLRIVGEVATFGLSDGADHLSGVLAGARLADPEYVVAMVRVADGIEPVSFPAAVFPDAEYGPPVVPKEVGNLAELRPLMPLVLLAFAALGCVGVVQLVLAVATRSRRDLAVLRAVGVSRSSAVGVVLVAVLVTCGAAIAIAGPVGTALGRLSWQAASGGTSLGVAAVWPPQILLVALAVCALSAISGVLAGRWIVRRHPASELAAE